MSERTEPVAVTAARGGVTLVTFGDARYARALARIRDEAETSGHFARVWTYTPDDFDADFLHAHGDFIARNRRGYGYWVWKPFVVRHALSRLADGDVLVYADAGCTIRREGAARLDQFVKAVAEAPCGLLAFSNRAMECRWTKRDTLDAFGPDAHRQYGHTRQVVATTFVVRKCDATVAFMEAWSDMCRHHHWVDDTPSVVPNDPEFKDHRHDQSLFSMLCKTRRAAVLQDEEHVLGPIVLSRKRQLLPLAATRPPPPPPPPPPKSVSSIRSASSLPATRVAARVAKGPPAPQRLRNGSVLRHNLVPPPVGGRKRPGLEKN